jgi:hypothetical protein
VDTDDLAIVQHTAVVVIAGVAIIIAVPELLPLCALVLSAWTVALSVYISKRHDES